MISSGLIVQMRKQEAELQEWQADKRMTASMQVIIKKYTLYLITCRDLYKKHNEWCIFYI